MELSYILKLRNALKPEYRHMPIFQSGSAIIVENENKEIEVVKGDGSELEFSPVYEHLNAAKPKPKDEKKKNIIIPEVKKK